MPRWVITPFNTGKMRGLRAYFISTAGEQNHGAQQVLDVSEFFNRKLINRIGSIEVFSQYGTLRVIDRMSGLNKYYPPSSMACYPYNTIGKQFDLTYFGSLASTHSYELVLYEDILEGYAVGVPLP